MLAAIKTEKEREIIVEVTEKPVLKSGEVLIQVDYCGVCGSDLHAYNHSKGYEFVKKPIILGHEISGKVVEVYNSGSKGLLNKNVIIKPMNYCNECENCKNGRKSICLNIQVLGLHFNGGMSQLVKTKEKHIREIPADLSLKIAALSEPMAIAVHAVEIAKDITKDQVILVQGPGIIGFFVSLVCVQKGAKVILSGLEKDYENRLSKCLDFGIIPHVVERGALQEKVDILFECSGSNAAIKSGFNSLKKGGKAVFVALYEETTNLFLTDLVRNEWPILTSYGCNPVDFDVALEVLSKYAELLDNIVSVYPLQETSKAFQDGLNQKVLKPILRINEDKGEL